MYHLTGFMFGSHAHYYVENGMGRYISKEKAHEIAKRNGTGQELDT